MPLTNANLHEARKNKNDEFYTRYEDIEAEVMKYREQFKDKIVYYPVIALKVNFGYSLLIIFSHLVLKN